MARSFQENAVGFANESLHRPMLSGVRNFGTDCLRLVESEDLLALGCLVLLTLFIGQRFICTRPEIHQWSLRFGFATFAAFVARWIYLQGVEYSGNLIQGLIRGGLAAGLVIGVSDILLPLARFAYDNTVGRFVQIVKSWQMRLRMKRQAVAARARAAQQKIESDRIRANQEAAARQKRLKDAELKAQSESDKKVREQIRFDCQLLYDRLYPQLRDRFPRKRLAEYLANYMSDDHPVDEVRDRSVRLQKMLQDCVTPPGQSNQEFVTVAAIAAHFSNERQQIVNSELTKDIKESMLSHLNWEEDRAIQELND